MFYSVELLSAHRGKFGIIWLAATHVRKCLSRRELNSVNIVSACEEITSCIVGKMRMRFSLYLAAQLAYGLCIIYREKMKIMLRDLQELCFRTSYKFQQVSVDLPATGKTTSRSKKRKRTEDHTEIPEVPLSGATALLGDFGDLQIPDILCLPHVNPDMEFLDTHNSVNQARLEDITLLEDNLNLMSGFNLTFGDELAPSNAEFLQEISLGASAFSKNQDPSMSKLCMQSPEPHRRLEDAHPPKSKVPKLATVGEQETSYNAAESNMVLNENTFELATTADVQQTDAYNFPAGRNDASEAIQRGVEYAEKLHMDSETLLAHPREEMQETTLQPQSIGHEMLNTAQVEPRGLMEPELLNFLEQHLPEVHLSQLNLIPLVEIEPITIADQAVGSRRRRVIHTRLMVDEKTRLSTQELRWNMDHGESTMLPASVRLAEPASRTRTQYLVSRCVPRLLALPSSVGTLFSKSLCESWCKHRRFVEQHLSLMGEELERNRVDNFTTPRDPLVETQLRESSIEQPRAGTRHNTISVGASGSLLGQSNLDMTVNQGVSILDSMLSTKTPVPAPEVTEKFILREENSFAEQQQQQQQLEIDQMPPQIDPRDLVPLPEEREEWNRQHEPQGNLDIERIENEVYAHEGRTVVSPLYENAEKVKEKVQELFQQNSMIDIALLCPENCSKIDASRAFYALLELAKKRIVKLTQKETFGPIFITSF